MDQRGICFLCIAWSGLLLVKEGECATGTNARDLRTKLFVTDAYDSKTRPSITDQSDPIEVYVNFYLLSINELSEASETLKTTGYLGIKWKDEYLTWTPATYGGIDYYFWPQGDVWKPDVALKNSFLEYKELGVSSLNVQVISDGTVYWYPFQVFQSTCSIDVKYFPFDVQECKLEFVAWSYTKDEVAMMSGEKGIVMDGFEPNSEWEVLDTSYKVDMESVEAAVVFTIKLKRKPLYYLLSVILPIIMLAILNIFVFMLPSQCGEKASYAITVFLAFAVFLSIISSSFPANSDVVAVFSIYLIILTLQSTLITLLALVLIRCSLLDHEITPVPSFMAAFVSLMNCKTCGVPKRRNKVIDVQPVDEPQNEEKEDEDSIAANSRCTWKEVSNTMDKVFAIFFTFVLIVASLVFFIITATKSG